MVAALRMRLWPGTFDRKSLPWRSRVERFLFRSLVDEQASGPMPPARIRSPQNFWPSASFSVRCRLPDARAIRRNVKSARCCTKARHLPPGLPYAPVDTPNQFDMPNQKSGGRIWRCWRRSPPPIASSNDPTSRPSTPMNGPGWRSSTNDSATWTRRKPRAIASLCCRRPAHAKSSRSGNESRPVNSRPAPQAKYSQGHLPAARLFAHDSGAHFGNFV